jgi:hypothetical protein
MDAKLAASEAPLAEIVRALDEIARSSRIEP